MGISIGDKPEVNVVNVGDELSQNQINALNASAINGSPSATNPFLTRTNTFNTTDAAVFVTQSGTGDAFRITNTGSGHSFIVEDDTNPDSTPFVINSLGNIGVGRQPSTRKMEIQGNFGVSSACTFDGTVSIGGALTLASSTLNLSVGAQTYPHEISFIIGGVTYRVPARAI